MKKLTEEFLKEVIKKYVTISRVKDSNSGAMVERERIDVKAIVKDVMEALRTKRKKASVKKKKAKIKIKKKKKKVK